MIRLACNYYPETEELVSENIIDIDYFKFPALGYQMRILDGKSFDKFAVFTERVRKYRPILYHGLYPAAKNLLTPQFKEDFQLDMAEKLFQLTGTPGISLHIDGAEENVPVSTIVKRAITNLNFIKEHFPTAEFLAIENVPNYKAVVSNPEVIREIVASADVQFLLDISHAYKVAVDAGEDFYAYLHRLPLDCVSEIHINGWVEKDGDIMAHTKIKEIGYSTLQHLLGYCNPKIITLEYGRDKDRIRCGCPIMKPDEKNERAKEEIYEQYIRLREIIDIHKLIEV